MKPYDMQYEFSKNVGMLKIKKKVAKEIKKILLQILLKFMQSYR